MDSADRALKEAGDALRSDDPSEMLSAGLRLQIAGVALTRAVHSGAGHSGRNGALARALIAQGAAIVTIISGLFLFGYEQLDQRISRVEERLGQRIFDVEERLGQRVFDVEERLEQRVSGVEERLDRRMARMQTEMNAGFRRVDERLDVLEAGTARMQSDIEAIASRLDVPVRMDRGGGSEQP